MLALVKSLLPRRKKRVEWVSRSTGEVSDVWTSVAVNYIDYQNESFARAHQVPLHVNITKSQLTYLQYTITKT